MNYQLHSSAIYNTFQITVGALAVFTAGAASTMTCFIAGTMILTASGVVAIENIKSGDKVLSTNADTFETAEKQVLETYIRETSQLVYLTINGELITTTADHPFYIKNHGFIDAGNLQVGNEVINSNGDTYTIENIYVEIARKPITVYNFQVEDFHTYHVGDVGILVHNANRADYVGRTPGKSSRTGKEVTEKMRKEGNVKNINGTDHFKAGDGKWYPLDKADIAHLRDAVDYWNNEGINYGPKSPEVREFMLDSNNYKLEHQRINRSQGAKLNQTYKSP